MRLLTVITALIILATLICGKNLPDKFFGKFSLDHSENFDAYLSARGTFKFEYDIAGSHHRIIVILIEPFQ